jgi:ribosomal protein S18 acetylase RimI-like enzyme
MLRELRRSDIPQLFLLLERHFPEENALLGFDSKRFEGVVRRLFRPDYRFVMGFLKLVGRPVFRCFVIEIEGHLAAMAILTYNRRAGYVSSVMVDTPYRRKGYAREILTACSNGAQTVGRSFTVLDVLATNTPARALYDREGFRWLRTQMYMTREISPSPTGTAEPTPAPPIRPVRKGDTDALMALATRTLPKEVGDVLPIEKSHFQSSGFVDRSLQSVSEGWVVDRGAGPEAYVRAAVSGLMAAGNLSAPLLAPELPGNEARALIGHALSWLAAHGAVRALTEVPSYASTAQELLAAEGFTKAFEILTLYRPNHG